MSTDAQLVRAAQEGDRAALETLLKRNYERVYAVCRRITGNDADAADAAQEAMIAAVRGLSRFDGRATFATWLYRIATNASLDELRRRRRRPVPEAAIDTGQHDAADTDQRVEATAVRLELDEALRALPDDFRAAVVLRDVADLDYEEIAVVLDIPVGTVKSRIARGRGALAVSLGRWRGNQEGGGERPRDAP